MVDNLFLLSWDAGAVRGWIGNNVCRVTWMKLFPVLFLKKFHTYFMPQARRIVFYQFQIFLLLIAFRDGLGDHVNQKQVWDWFQIFRPCLIYMTRTDRLQYRTVQTYSLTQLHVDCRSYHGMGHSLFMARWHETSQISHCLRSLSRLLLHLSWTLQTWNLAAPFSAELSCRKKVFQIFSRLMTSKAAVIIQ